VTAREVSEPNARPDLRQRFGRLLRLSNPVVRRMISAGLPTGAPCSPGGEGSAVA